MQQIPKEAVIAAIKTAVEAGCTFLDGGEFYGTPKHNSLTILRSYFEKYPEDANKVVVNIKGALGPGHIPNGSKEKVSASIENCLRLLGPVGRIDQFEPGRRDPNHDFENETLATIDSYVKSGKIGGISLSEVNADTIRSATKKFKITAVEIELSLFTTDPLTNGVLEACGELSIPVLAYSKSTPPPPPQKKKILILAAGSFSNLNRYGSSLGSWRAHGPCEVSRRPTRQPVFSRPSSPAARIFEQQSETRGESGGHSQAQRLYAWPDRHQLDSRSIQAPRDARDHSHPRLHQPEPHQRERHRGRPDG